MNRRNLMVRRLCKFAGLAVLVLAIAGSLAQAEDFQLIVAQLPPGGGNQQLILRYDIAGSGGAMTQLSSIPAELTNDPAGIAFRTPQELFVANRFGNNGPGSVSRFTFDNTFVNFIQSSTITGNGLSKCHQAAFDPLTGELFVRNRDDNNVSRFLFDSLGQPIANGELTGFAQGPGVTVRSDGLEVFVGDYDGTIHRLQRSGTTFITLPSIIVSAGNTLHYLKFAGGELYACALANGIHRIAFDGAGMPIEKPTIPIGGTIDVAFSPDGSEMFAANHGGGGITRLAYDSPTDVWNVMGFVPTPSLGGLATTHAAVVTNCGLIGDMNIDGSRDGRDIGGLLKCMLNNGGTNCPCGDTNANGAVEPGDIPGFVQLLLVQ